MRTTFYNAFCCIVRPGHRWVWVLFILLYTWVGLPHNAQGQSTVKGKVTDASNGDPLPFVNVFIRKTTSGVATDFDGNFSFTVPAGTDSITASYIGYFPRTKKIPVGADKVLNFQLKSSDLSLDEVVIRPGENPAWPIMRATLANKDKNDKRGLTGWEYDSYNRVEIDADNLTDRLRKSRMLRKITAVMDSVQRMAGEDGKPILPLFISESVTVIYHRQNPTKQKEKIVKTKVSGIGIESSSLVNQLIGSTFQEYNFYNNWVDIVNKNFVSPIADGWKFYYDYELIDSSQIDNSFCYRIDFFPKREQDLAFWGSMWITKEEYALKRINAVVKKAANINFIEGVKIQQELIKTASGPWLPSKNRVTINVAQLSTRKPGMLAKFYTSNRNFKVNDEKPLEFYNTPIEMLENNKEVSEGYWEQARHEPLSVTEKNVFRMIDTVKRLPVIRSYVEVANIFVNGYKRIGPIDYGPYLYTYSFNNVEGQRFRLGFQTNPDFSKKFLFRTYVAYGLKDERFKYELLGEYIYSRKNWTVFGTRYKEDLELLSMSENSSSANRLFSAFNRFGNLNRTRPFFLRSGNIYVATDIQPNLTLTTTLQTQSYSFFADFFDFLYQKQGTEGVSKRSSTFNTSELQAELRFTPGELFIEERNSRTNLGISRKPTFTFKYVRGFNNFLKGNLDYDKFSGSISQNVRFGILGNGRYVIDAGIIPHTLPYPLLRAHLGNQTPFYNASSFNMMRFFEFVSDRWVQVRYQHYFEGLGFNSVPLIRKWNLRLLATSNVLVGNLSRANVELARKSNNDMVSTFTSLGRKPYIEVGYGVENIFRLLRIDFIHRLTYLNHKDPTQTGNQKVPPFGVKASLQFKI
jgi:hypothetical protein